MRSLSSKIGEESEAVVLKIYEMEDKVVKDLQKEESHKRSVSIWESEELERQKRAKGREAPSKGKLGLNPEQ